MQVPAFSETFEFKTETVKLLVPSEVWMKDQLTTAATDDDRKKLYWAQVWPAAKALCEFIVAEPAIIKNKNVVELAAGLGLPSLLASRYAKTVLSTDYIPAAVELLLRSAAENSINNLQAVLHDWHDTGIDFKPDVLLLSDVNYEPGSFAILYEIITRCISYGSIVILSTPQRLAGKPFIESLLHYCSQQQNFEILHKGEAVHTSVFVLKK